MFGEIQMTVGNRLGIRMVMLLRYLDKKMNSDQIKV